MPRALLLIMNRQFVRSWIQTAILDDMTKFMTVEVACDRSSLDALIGEGVHPVYSDLPQSNTLLRVASIFSSTSTMQGKRTYSYALRRHFFGLLRLGRHSEESLYKYLPRLIRALARGILRVGRQPWGPIVLMLPVRANRLVARGLYSTVARGKSFKKLVEIFERYDALIFASNGSENELQALLQVSRHANTLSVYCPDNWDNLSSKASLAILPDRVCAMGPATAEAGIKKHGLNPATVWITGLPKFKGVLEQPSKKRTGSRPKSIGYFGFSQNQREHEFVNKIADFLDDEELTETEIVYRPHPFRITMPETEPSLRPRIVQHHHDEGEKEKYGNYPSLDPKGTYFDELREHDIVISGPTTMALESMLLGIPTLIDMRVQEHLVTSPMNTLLAYPHYKDLMEMRGVSIFYDSEKGLEQLTRILRDISHYTWPAVEDVVERRAFSSLLMGKLREEFSGHHLATHSAD